MRVTIDVTATDIRKGLPKSFLHCPIALATQRRLRVGRTSAAGGRLYVYREGLDTDVYDLPEKARRFMEAIDLKGRRAVKPMRFALEVEAK